MRFKINALYLHQIQFAMIEKSPSSEEKIRAAATKVFLAKGFDGATTRAIAEESGMNLALVNYYFRSKEKLFSEIFDEMLRIFFEGMVELFNKPLTLKEKITALFDHDFEMSKNNPDLDVFIISELHRNPERFFKMVKLKSMINYQFFDAQFKEGVEQGIIKPIKVENALALIILPMQSIFSTKTLIMHVLDMDIEQFNVYAKTQYEITKDMVLKYLFVD